MTTDGIGVTTLVAAYGCLLRCQYCLNPHSWQQETNQCEYTPEKLLNEVKQDNLYFLATGGGITFGGGEPDVYNRQCIEHPVFFTHQRVFDTFFI